MSETNEPLNVLVIDDQLDHAEAVAAGMARINATTFRAHSEKEAFAAIESRLYDVVVTDLMLESPTSGISIIKKCKEVQPETEVIVMTGSREVETAVTAIKEGAFNYLIKPLDLKQLRAIVQRAGDSTRLRRVNRQLTEHFNEQSGLEGVIGNSESLLMAVNRLRRIAPTDAAVLILGETGTGKELFARAIHQLSPRKNRPFVALNCAALSENILESELFGHVKGAFTGATENHVGKFEYAQGGTVFLDEVGDMPPQTQVKLLRVLENHQITRVGANETIDVDVRLLSATNRDLEEAMKQGTFREDLYHRLKVISLRLPSLRERTEDLPILLDHFFKIFSQKYGKKINGISQGARRRLLAYDWPGNIRQLKNAAEGMIIVDYDEFIDVDDLPEEILELYPLDAPLENSSESKQQESLPAENSVVADPVLSPSAIENASPERILSSLVGHTMDEVERLFIAETLRACGGNREATAKTLGIGERTLYRKIKELDEEKK